MSSSQCCANPPLLNPSCGDGSVEQLGGLKTYVTGSNSKLALVLISDVFGYEAPKLRKLADKVASHGFFVVVPDFFYGDPMNEITWRTPEFDKQLWLKKHSPEKGSEDAKLVIAALKAKGVSAVGAAGFCWGAMVVVKLAATDDDIKAGVMLHPGPITVDEIEKVKIPLQILGAEIDHTCPPEQVKQLGEILSAKPEVDSFVKIFPGVSHGWTVRYKDEDESEVRSAEEAHSHMLNWFTKYVK
jgi:carboxymethylenebutenolidase